MTRFGVSVRRRSVVQSGVFASSWLLLAGALAGACGGRGHCLWCEHGGSAGFGGFGGFGGHVGNDAGAVGGSAGVDAGATDGSVCLGSVPTACPATPPSYDADIAPIVQQKCLGCHSSGGVEASQPLVTYADMSARGFTTIQQRVRDCQMPPIDSPTGPLTAAQRETLLSWLVCGAPNGTATQDAGTLPEASIGPGGIVPGPDNGVCDLPDGGKIQQAVDASVCDNPPPPDQSGGSDYAPTNYGSEADDDDCKYHLSISLSPVAVNADVTFTVKLTSTITGEPVTGANLTDAEIFIAGTSHIAPSSGATSVEGPPGTYTFGPIHFDESARWTIRFHLFDTYCDAPASPHGHAAFYIDVP